MLIKLGEPNIQIQKERSVGWCRAITGGVKFWETFLDSTPAVNTQGRTSASLWTAQLQVLLNYSSSQKKAQTQQKKPQISISV